MTEKVVIPPAGPDRDRPAPRDAASRPATTSPTSPATDLVPEMAHAGDGYRFHVTGLTHDERGYPAMNAGRRRRSWSGGCIDKIRATPPTI